MKYEVEAKEDVNQHVGGFHLKAKEGAQLTLSQANAEIALQSGSFKFLREVNDETSEPPIKPAQKKQTKKSPSKPKE